MHECFNNDNDCICLTMSSFVMGGSYIKFDLFLEIESLCYSKIKTVAPKVVTQII